MKSPLPKTPGKCPSCAFTLIEILVSLGVMALLTVLLAQITNGTSQSMRSSRSRLDADQEARSVFDRIGSDLAAMPKEKGIDYIFSKQSGNDKWFFFSSVSGFFETTQSFDTKSPFSLVAYRVNADTSQPKLERIAKALNWKNTADSSTMLFLTPSASSFAPLEETTIAGNPAWRSIVGTAPNYDGNDSNYSPLSGSVYRLEFCYLLKDGTYSNKPVIEAKGVANQFTSLTAPTSTDSSKNGFSPGSRWYNNTDQRAYICIDAYTDAAVWKPLGMDDVSAIVVAIAILDPSSLKGTSSLAKAIQAFPDVTDADLSENPPKLMAASWDAIRNQTSFANTAELSNNAASKVYIYQRHFSITPQ